MEKEIKRYPLHSAKDMLDEIKIFKKERTIAIYGDEDWEDVRMDPIYSELWKNIKYYIQRCDRIIIINGYISHSTEPDQIGQILWSDGSKDNYLRQQLC